MRNFCFRSFLAPFLLSLVISVVLFATSPGAQAFIVAGANGGSNTTNNTTAASLNEVVPNFFPYFANIISYSDATGIYLGHDENNKIWVLTAAHVNNSNASVTIQGLSYNFEQRYEAAGDGSSLNGVSGDMELLRYGRADTQVPQLPAVKLASAAPPVNALAVLIGRGQSRVETAETSASTGNFSIQGGKEGYDWAGPRIMRWGTNSIERAAPTGPPVSTRTFNIGTRTITGFQTKFHKPASGDWLTSNEAQGSLGDSGGSAFIYVNGEWQLAGIASAVTASVLDFASFGDTTIFNDVATHKAELEAITGHIVPEPGTASLILLAAASLLCRRRRA